jgi:CheY-like chemotaxis protein
VIRSRQIGPADRSRKQGVAHEQVLTRRAAPANLQADAARAVSGRMVHLDLEVAEQQSLTIGVEVIDGWHWLDLQSEHFPVLDRALVQEGVVLVHVDRHIERPLRRRNAGDVIHVRMGQENVTDLYLISSDEIQELANLIARIDEHSLTRPLAGHHEAVLEKWSNRPALDYHFTATMILAIVDDLMFTSKIKTAAAQLNVPLTFARTSEGALAEMRKTRPTLVILDLNSARTEPLRTVAAMRSDPLLADIPSLGFVSHVQTGLIDAARQAGVGEVMARSAFTMQLPEILARGQ